MSAHSFTKTALIGLASALLLLAPACAKEGADSTAAPHGSHDPAHGGMIGMTADLHFETVLDSAGRHRVYFSDGARAPLPASTLAAVSMTLERRGAAPERLELEQDASGAFWAAEGRPLGSSELTKVAVTFNRPGEPPISMPLALPEHGRHEH